MSNGAAADLGRGLHRTVGAGVIVRAPPPQTMVGRRRQS